MAAEVSSLSRLLNGGGGGGDRTDSGKSSGLITRDLLGGPCTLLDSKELDLDMQVPSGWEKRLDLKSGKVYIQKCDPTNSSSKTHQKQANDAMSKLQDLNLPPSSKQPLNLSDENNLDLKLVLFPTSSSSVSPAASCSSFHSVCTLDKVKSALERAERETNTKRRSASMMSSSPPSHSSSSIRDGSSHELLEDEEEKSSATFAAGCPNCLLYVLISRNNPKCPRCYATVPSPTALKKPRIDLNISL